MEKTLRNLLKKVVSIDFAFGICNGHALSPTAGNELLIDMDAAEPLS